MYPNPYFASSSLGEPTAGAGILADQDATGDAPNLAAVPNLGQITGVNGRIRCAGMGLRITYEGTELTRAGRYVAGHPNIINHPSGRSISGTSDFSALSTWTKDGAPTAALGDLQQVMRNVSVARIADGVFEAHWLPSGVPQYMTVNGPAPSIARAASGTGYSPLNQGPGLIGQEVGQAALCVLIDGDVTPAAQTYGNSYAIDMIWHWEFIPENLYATVLPLSPSPYSPMELAQVLNRIQQTPSATMPVVGASRAPAGEPTVITGRDGGIFREAAKLGVKLVEAHIRSKAYSRNGNQRSQRRAISFA